VEGENGKRTVDGLGESHATHSARNPGKRVDSQSARPSVRQANSSKIKKLKLAQKDMGCKRDIQSGKLMLKDIVCLCLVEATPGKRVASCVGDRIDDFAVRWPEVGVSEKHISMVRKRCLRHLIRRHDGFLFMQ
jgi:hypothetical protein